MAVCDWLKIIVYMSILFYLKNIQIISDETQELLSFHVGIINKTNAAFIFTFPAISSSFWSAKVIKGQVTTEYKWLVYEERK